MALIRYPSHISQTPRLSITAFSKSIVEWSGCRSTPISSTLNFWCVLFSGLEASASCFVYSFPRTVFLSRNFVNNISWKVAGWPKCCICWLRKALLESNTHCYEVSLVSRIHEEQNWQILMVHEKTFLTSDRYNPVICTRKILWSFFITHVYIILVKSN